MLKQVAKAIIPAPVRQTLRRAQAAGRQCIAKTKQHWYRKFLVEKRLRAMRRGRRDRCWCGGELAEFQWHPNYGVCKSCGSYVNRRPPLREELEKFYSMDMYWHLKQKADGFPTIEDRPANDTRDGRVDYWLGLIGRHGTASGQVVEIGCAHGLLLKCLQERGYRCVGVEVDEKVAAWTRQNMGVEVRAGFFPGVDLPACDVFVSFDVFEHSPEPEAFVREAGRLLKPGGVAIIQTAVDRYKEVPPFGSRFNDAFDDVEHLFIFTDQAVKELAKRAQLEVVSLDERVWLMGEIFVLRKPD